MKHHFIGFLSALLFVHAARAEERGPGWFSDPQHPSLQYRFVCMKGAQRVIWRNGYPGAVTLKARMLSYTYDGMEDVQIDPGAITNTDLDTLACGSFQISVTRFSMAAPPPPPPTGADAKASAPVAPKADPPPAPIMAKFEPQTEPVREIAVEALASIAVGMSQSEVRRRLGEPLSRISIPDENGVIETYRYHVMHDRSGIVKMTNGIVTATNFQ